MARHLIREIPIDAARAVVGGMHPGAGDRLVAVHQIFPFPEAVQEHRHCPDVESVCPQPHQVIENARDLVEHHANVLGPQRWLDAQQFFNRQHIAMFIAHHGHVIEAVHVADALVVGFTFGQFLSRPVQQADMGIRLGDHLPIQFQHQPQNTVSRRVLRSKVHGVVLDFRHGPCP